MNIRSSVFLFSIMFALSGCGQVSDGFQRLKSFIEGEDRIEMDGSTANVGPLVAEDEEVTEAILPKAESKEAVEQTPIASVVQAKPVTKKTPTPVPSAEADEKIAKPNQVEQKQSSSPLVIKNSSEGTVSENFMAKDRPKSAAEILEQVKQQAPAQVAPQGAVIGRIGLMVDNQLTSSEGVLISLEPVDEKKRTTPVKRAGKIHIVDMKDKEYQPGNLAISTNDTVFFKNSDAIRHNVFSSSGENAFDLGTYSGGKKRSVNFDSDGIVKVYCNIHPEMATFISVNSVGLSTVTDAKGNFRLENVPEGDYKMHAWHIRGELWKSVTIRANKSSEIAATIMAKNVEVTDHKNKFGETYKEKPALFEDEFY